MDLAYVFVFLLKIELLLQIITYLQLGPGLVIIPRPYVSYQTGSVPPHLVQKEIKKTNRKPRKVTFFVTPGCRFLVQMTT